MLRFTQGLAKKTGPLKQIFWSQTTTWNFRTPISFLKDWIHLLTYFWCVAFLASLILFANRFVEWRKDIGVGPFIPPDLVMWTQETWRTENQFISPCLCERQTHSWKEHFAAWFCECLHQGLWSSFICDCIFSHVFRAVNWRKNTEFFSSGTVTLAGYTFARLATSELISSLPSISNEN